MGVFDWIIAAILLASLLVGIFRGFIKESLSITSWILAYWLADNYGIQAGEFLHQYIDIPAPAFRQWIGFAFLFITILFTFSVISYIIAKIFVREATSGVDRVLGLGFGLLRGAAIVVVILVFARGLGMENADWWKNSKYIVHFDPFVQAVYDQFPDSGLVPEEEGPDWKQKATEQTLKVLTDS